MMASSLFSATDPAARVTTMATAVEAEVMGTVDAVVAMAVAEVAVRAAVTLATVATAVTAALDGAETRRDVFIRPWSPTQQNSARTVGFDEGMSAWVYD